MAVLHFPRFHSNIYSILFAKKIKFAEAEFKDLNRV